MSRKLLLALLVIPALLLGVALAEDSDKDSAKLTKAPEFSLQDTTGKTHKLS